MTRRTTRVAAAMSTGVVTGVAAAAFGFVTALGSGTDTGTSPDPDRDLALELADNAEIGDPRVFSADGMRVRVAARNPGSAPLTVVDRDEMEPDLRLPEGCPPGSFVVSRPRVTERTVPGGAGSPGRQPVVVGSFVFSFVDQPGINQEGCLDAEVDFVWS